jgi:Protein of unknown function (DUF1566)
MIGTGTTTIELPTVAGTPLAGGVYAGRFFVDAQPYALIIAPGDGGELDATAWGGSKKVAAATSFNDGPANTTAMAKAGSKLAQWAQALRLAEHDDWYLPSRLELLIAFGALPTTDVFAKDWYWSSTQCASLNDYAWFQDFGYGYQYDIREDVKLRARAVRRLVIE